MTTAALRVDRERRARQAGRRGGAVHALDQRVELGLQVGGGLAGDGPALERQAAARGIARQLLAALDQRGVHRGGADERVRRPVVQVALERGEAAQHGRHPVIASTPSAGREPWAARPAAVSTCAQAKPLWATQTRSAVGSVTIAASVRTRRAPPASRCSRAPRRRPPRRRRRRRLGARHGPRRRAGTRRGRPSCRRRRGRAAGRPRRAGSSGRSIPSMPTVSMWRVQHERAPAAAAAAAATTLAGPAPPRSPRRRGRRRAASPRRTPRSRASPAPPGTRSGLTESIATRALTSCSAFTADTLPPRSPARRREHHVGLGADHRADPDVADGGELGPLAVVAADHGIAATTTTLHVDDASSRRASSGRPACRRRTRDWVRWAGGRCPWPAPVRRPAPLRQGSGSRGRS